MNNTKKTLLRGVVVGVGCFLGQVAYHTRSGRPETGFAVGVTNFVLVIAVYGVWALLVSDKSDSRTIGQGRAVAGAGRATRSQAVTSKRRIVLRRGRVADRPSSDEEEPGAGGVGDGVRRSS